MDAGVTAEQFRENLYLVLTGSAQSSCYSVTVLCVD